LGVGVCVSVRAPPFYSSLVNIMIHSSHAGSSV
jgi:hypothetical protein